MTQQLRRARDRAERERRIVAAARELAEAEGWDAVTTRRLAAKIEYSQPVLYSHFSGKDAIMAAAAVEGCAELAEQLGGAAFEPSPLAAVAEAYVAFADANPALYDAMFTLASELPFATDEAPQALRDAFGAIAAAVAPVAGKDAVGTLAETFWAALHGLVTLDRGRRLSPGHRAERLAILVARFGGGASGPAD
ncbi:TetR/AcrR family transcriptional regulator [Amycolatopsis sp. NPDC059027]|uniref:TetR/AcrR family transcriptional regulator n=1 Tax=unclassified Amycolatopsis TaxID=2618356 RepID=UPI0036710AFD